MRIPCPCCGYRGHDEFVYYGDATLARPDATAENAEQAFHDYVHLRDNPSGRHRELWYHAAGCHAWLVTTRDMRSHEISTVELAVDARPDRRGAEAP
jgi:methylglutamate dehydrogenase subunit B